VADRRDIHQSDVRLNDLTTISKNETSVYFHAKPAN
jgi:hypothetical protein